MDTPESEDEKVRSWLAQQFHALGCHDREVAELLANGVDYHELERMIRDGCPRELAQKILL